VASPVIYGARLANKEKITYGNINITAQGWRYMTEKDDQRIENG